MEQQAQQGRIDLFYADETQVSEQGYVPYGWQFRDERVSIPTTRGKRRNYFGLLSRDNRLHWQAFDKNVTSLDIITYLDSFAMSLKKPTVVILDNAKVHTSNALKACLAGWQERNLYLFYLPPYSPHFNIIERLWKELKAGWLRPEDYQTSETLFYAVNHCLNAVGQQLHILFSTFQGYQVNND